MRDLLSDYADVILTDRAIVRFAFAIGGLHFALSELGDQDPALVREVALHAVAGALGLPAAG